MEVIIENKSIWQPKQIVVLIEIYDCIKKFENQKNFVSETFIINELNRKGIQISLRNLRRYLNFYMYTETLEKIVLFKGIYAYKIKKIRRKEDDK